MDNMNNQSVHPEPVEGCRSWFDKPVLSELFILRGPQGERFFPNVLSEIEGRAHHERSLPYALVQVICAQALKALQTLFL
jgi:hypothetical protein